jgi:hypothetical protein
VLSSLRPRCAWLASGLCCLPPVLWPFDALAECLMGLLYLLLHTGRQPEPGERSEQDAAAAVRGGQVPGRQAAREVSCMPYVTTTQIAALLMSFFLHGCCQPRSGCHCSAWPIVTSGHSFGCLCLCPHLAAAKKSLRWRSSRRSRPRLPATCSASGSATSPSRFAWPLPVCGCATAFGEQQLLLSCLACCLILHAACFVRCVLLVAASSTRCASSSLLPRNFMSCSQPLCCLRLQLDSGDEYPAHRIVLCAQSAVFKVGRLLCSFWPALFCGTTFAGGFCRQSFLSCCGALVVPASLQPCSREC